MATTTEVRYCPRCGHATTPGSRFCTRCGTALEGTGAPSPGATAGAVRAGTIYAPRKAVDLGGQEYVLASWWRRFGSVLIDGFTVGMVLNVLTTVMLYGGTNFDVDNIFNTTPSQRMLLITGFAGVLFHWIGEASGWSPGRAALGIRVLRKDGARPGLVHGLARMGGKYIGGLAFMLGYLWAAWDRHNRAWHDFMASTYVVHRPPREANVAAPVFPLPHAAAVPAGATAAPRVPFATGAGAWLAASIGALLIGGSTVLGAWASSSDFERLVDEWGAGFHFPGEFRAAHPIPPPEVLDAAGPNLTRPPGDCAGRELRVCFVVIGDPPGVPVDDLVRYYAREYELAIEVLPPLAVAPLGVARPPIADHNRGQLDARALLVMLADVYPDLRDDPHVTLIALTGHDLYDSEAPLDRWRLNAREWGLGRFAVISTARLDETAWGFEADEAALASRTRKLVSRNIGALHYGLAWSDDPDSVMYARVFGIADLDRMRQRLVLPRPNASELLSWRGVGEAMTPVFELGPGRWELCAHLEGRADGGEGHLLASAYTADGIWLANARGRGVTGSLGCFEFATNPGRYQARLYAFAGTEWRAEVRPRTETTRPIERTLALWDPSPNPLPPSAGANPLTYTDRTARVTSMFTVPDTEWSFCWEFLEPAETQPSVDAINLRIVLSFEDETGRNTEWSYNAISPGTSGCEEVRWQQPGRFRLFFAPGGSNVEWLVTIPAAVP